jgi:hypothetical protein
MDASGWILLTIQLAGVWTYKSVPSTIDKAVTAADAGSAPAIQMNGKRQLSVRRSFFMGISLAVIGKKVVTLDLRFMASIFVIFVDCSFDD